MIVDVVESCSDVTNRILQAKIEAYRIRIAVAGPRIQALIKKIGRHRDEARSHSMASQLWRRLHISTMPQNTPATEHSLLFLKEIDFAAKQAETLNSDDDDESAHH